MSMATDQYHKARAKFESKLSMNEINLIVDLHDDINKLGEGPAKNGFQNWTGNQLSQAEERLARRSEMLGDIQAEAETKSEWLKAWIDEEYAKKYPEKRTEIIGEQGKVTDKQIMSELDANYGEEKQEMILWKGLSRKYSALLRAIDRVMLATTHRIKELERENYIATK